MRQTISGVIFTIIFIFATYGSKGVNHESAAIRFRNLNIQSGMVSNEVNTIHQDGKGFIWLATTNGLSRFDGYEFMHFRANYMSMDFFSSNTILNFNEDKQNRLWLVTPKGINVFDPYDQSVKKLERNEFGQGKIKAIEFADDNTVLIGGSDGLSIYDISRDSLRCFTHDALGVKFNANYVKSIYKDSKGNFWVGTWKKGIWVINSTMDRIISPKHPLITANLTANCFKEDQDGNMYVGTWEDGLMYLENPLDQNRIEVKQLLHDKRDVHHGFWNIIYDIDIDNQQRVWLGSPSGLRIISPSRNGFIIHNQNLIMDDDKPIQLHEVKYIFRDKSGLMWLSDYGNGVMVTEPHYSEITEIDLRKNGINFSIVTAIHKESDNELWLGVRGQGLVRYDISNNSIITTPNSALNLIDNESNSIIGFAEIPENDQLFMATRYFGVYELSKRGQHIRSIRHIKTEKEPVRNGFTNAIAKDSQNNIWIATKGGVVLLEYVPSTKTHIQTEPLALNDSLKNCIIETIFVDNLGAVWLGSSESGLFRVVYDSNKSKVNEFNNYNVLSKNINSNKVQTIFQDTRNRIWVGTHGGGLSEYQQKDNRFEMIKNMSLITSDVVVSIKEDSKGNLWLATGNGITCYNPDTEQGNIKNYGMGNGLKNTSFISGSALTIGDKMFFGGYDGLSIFQPDKLLVDRDAAPPSIVDIQIFNESLNQLPVEKRNKIAKFMPPYTTRIVLTHRDYSVSIRFACPSHENSSLNKYAYMLDGIDKKWNYVSSNQRIVTYTSLKPGNYTFNVIASNDQGIWNETPTKLEITVLPSPLETKLAYFVYILIVCLLIYMAYRIIRNRVQLRRALEIEQIERIKSDEVNNSKLIFFTNVSHELFTPITIMSCSLEKLLEADDGNVSLHLIIRSNLNRLMRLLQQVLEFRKADSANLKLKVSQTDIIVFIKRLCDENFAPLVSDKNVKLIFTSEQESLLGYIDPDKLDKIIYNLLSNAFKYNRPSGKVFVGIKLHDDQPIRQISISIRDTGLGIEAQQIPMLFKRFYEGDYRKFNTKGTGIGLSLTKDLIDLHKGSIVVDSRINEGTQFTVTLPIDSQAYDQEQIDSDIIELKPSESNITKLEFDRSNYGEHGRYTILLVEDNDELLLVMQNIMQPTYNIRTARNGDEALRVLSEHEIDLVVTDYVMPVMDGAELCGHIRSNLTLCHLPIIMLSAHSVVESKLKFFDAGIDAYVSKPFEIKLLIAQVNGLLTNRARMLQAFKQDKNILTDNIVSTGLDKKFIDTAISLIEEHIADVEFDINAFNKAMNMSNSTLYRKIKSITGMPPKEFIRNIRFKFACKLLLEKSSNVSEVAFMVGFNDAKYFSVSFKKEFGISPREYVNQNRIK